jgi:pyruvate formate lyase activating enzyme
MSVNTQAGLKEALYWSKGDNNSAKCRLCPLHCRVREGKSGACRVKKNIGGKLYATAYGLTTSLNIDPIEKKPLYHFHPGTSILSIGPNACNLRCGFCQNFGVSQENAPVSYLSPEEAAALALKTPNCVGVAYTYSEPLMWFEYLLDATEHVRRAGLKNVLVTNGHLEEEPFNEILPLIDAMNIDIKSMDESFYKKTCKGSLEPVLRNVESAAGKTHVEITNLVIPGLNDSDDNFGRLAAFLADIDPHIPLHFSRYHPAYKMDRPATPVETLLRARDIAGRRLKHVYVGNVLLPGGNDTLCPSCSERVVERDYMGLRFGGAGHESVKVKDGKCLKCGGIVNIVS